MDSPKKARNRNSRRLRPVDIDKIQTKFLNVLHRQADMLLDESFQEKISEQSAKNLINYLKLLKDFQQNELAALEMLTDEELQLRASTNTKQEKKHGEIL